MKVYVDDNEDYRITYSSRDGSECLESMGMQPIIVESLADYTKQVRKEVCEIIWGGFIGLNNINGNYEYKKFEDDFRKFLDQIQGVEDGRLD